MKIGIIDSFDSAHFLPNYDGICANIHGHTYTVEVVFEGPVDEKSGFVIDFHDLKRRLKHVIGRLDHKNLNDIMTNPTAERIAEQIWHSLEGEMEESQVELLSVKLWEGKNKWVMLD